ncbi:MAG TPA: hypothetical protein VF808_06385 [Ktedonobacterales bacterium]
MQPEDSQPDAYQPNEPQPDKTPQTGEAPQLATPAAGQPRPAADSGVALIALSLATIACCGGASGGLYSNVQMAEAGIGLFLPALALAVLMIVLLIRNLRRRAVADDALLVSIGAAMALVFLVFESVAATRTSDPNNYLSLGPSALTGPFIFAYVALPTLVLLYETLYKRRVAFTIAVGVFMFVCVALALTTVVVDMN